MSNDRELTREEMIQKLSQVTVVATPTVYTMDMGLEYDYITSEGAGSTLGSIGEWPAYKLHGVEDAQWKLIQEKERNHSLTEADLAGTDIGRLMKKLHNIYGDYYDEYYSDLSQVLESILTLPESLPEEIYCLWDLRSWGEFPLFFATEADMQMEFISSYCIDVEPWEEISNVEYWYDRFTDDLGGLAMIDYTDNDEDEE